MSANLEGLLNISLDKLKGLVDVNTIIGEPITVPDGTIIIPVSKVSFGYGSGGSDFGGNKPKDLFGGGSGAGVDTQYPFIRFRRPALHKSHTLQKLQLPCDGAFVEPQLPYDLILRCPGKRADRHAKPGVDTLQTQRLHILPALMPQIPVYGIDVSAERCHSIPSF